MIAQFALQLICGLSLMWLLLPRRDISSGFFRIQMLVTLGLSVLAALMVEGLTQATAAGSPVLSPRAALILSIALAAASFVGSVMWTLERRTAGTFFAGTVFGLSTATLILASPSPRSTAAALHILSQLSSASMLGGAVGGMLLGHWYLTAPTMSIQPLRRITIIYGIAGLARLVLSGITLWLGWDALSGSTQMVWLALRWLAGIIGPLVVAAMVLRILRYRNTQSATGVLFVGVILTFIGEATAALLYRELLIPY